MELINTIQQEMTRRGVTVYALANSTKLARSTVQDVFKHKNPTLNVLLCICEALDITVTAKPCKGK